MSAIERSSGAETSTPVRKKRRLLPKILLGLIAVVAILAVVVALQSPDFHVTRTATIAASPATVFEHVNDLHKWEDWSPWAKLDPAAQNSYEGPAAGEGATFRWNGNSDVGEGSMTITESKPSEFVRIRLDFVRPFAGTNDVEFTFKPQGDQTSVTWSMSGQKNFMAKAIGLVMDCEEMCGQEFDKGLANLKAVVEGK
jgi:uncharacterized protein YndB with AHSA1/START domain